MSSIRIHAIAGRVVLVHDMPDRVAYAELDVEQADVLLQQLEWAKRKALRSLRAQHPTAQLADMGMLADGAGA